MCHSNGCNSYDCKNKKRTILWRINAATTTAATATTNKAILRFPHTITSNRLSFSLLYFLINMEHETTATLAHASFVVIDTIYTHSGLVLACLIVQNSRPYWTYYHQNKVKNPILLNDFRHMPVSNPHLVLSCVGGHVDICRQSCRQLSTNRQAYSH